MRATDVNKSIFENKPTYRYRSYSSYFERTAKQNEKQEFVVPWQMTKVSEKKCFFE